MAKNDTVLIDGILDDRVAENLPSTRRDEAFEYFAFEQILRDADLSQDDIKAGWVDGRDDGGIDGFFILVNGHPLNDSESFLWPRSGCELDVWVITCKHHDTFRQSPMDNLVASLTELLDLSIAASNLKGSYSSTLLRIRSLLNLAYRKVSPRLSRFELHFAYASRGDSATVGDSIRARASQAVSIAKELFGTCNASFSFLGASELIALHRKIRPFSIELPFLEALTRGQRYVLLCRLTDFYAFVVDENKKLRRYLFDSNVRDFMGRNRVNEDIRNTLDDPESPDFWWLNNGITILANSATVIGKAIQLERVQIVNGLQTTESIAQHFGAGNRDPRERAVLVKVIVTTDPSIRDGIIRATNNQSAVELASLHATDKVQRDIEDVLLGAGWFYERRTNFYANQGHPASHIVSPLYLAAGYVNLILKSPSSASLLRARFMRSEDSYARVFSQSAPLKVWPVIAHILRRSDLLLESVRPVGTSGNERFLKKWRHITSFLAVARAFNRFSFSDSDLASFPCMDAIDELLLSSWTFVNTRAVSEPSAKKWRSKTFTIAICQDAATTYSICDVSVVEVFDAKRPNDSKRLQPQFVNQVDAALPHQPWKPGVHHVVAKQLGCQSSSAYAAIAHLVSSGKRNVQKHGIVYGSDGTVLAIDAERNAPGKNEIEKLLPH